MPSSFYSRRVLKKHPVSYLFLEVFARVCEKSSGISAPDAIAQTLQSIGVKPPYSAELIAQIADDMESIRDSKKAQASEAAPKKSQRSVGSEMIKWLASMELETLLLLATDFDYEAAERLYCDSPVELVDTLVQTRLQMESHRATVVFEAVVFGTGGKMKGGTGESEKVLDTTKAESNEEVMAQLKRFKFL